MLEDFQFSTILVSMIRNAPVLLFAAFAGVFAERSSLAVWSVLIAHFMYFPVGVNCICKPDAIPHLCVLLFRSGRLLLAFFQACKNYWLCIS